MQCVRLFSILTLLVSVKFAENKVKKIFSQLKSMLRKVDAFFFSWKMLKGSVLYVGLYCMIYTKGSELYYKPTNQFGNTFCVAIPIITY